MELAFNEKQITGRLSKIEPMQQLAFAASCCQRMLPNYETFVRGVGWGDAGPLREAVEVAWAGAASKRFAEPNLRSMLSACEACIPDSEQFTALLTGPAQDATFASCLVLKFLLAEDVSSIVRIARFSTDSVDLFVQEIESLDPKDPALELRILQHSLMQQELRRQRRDLHAASLLAQGETESLRSLQLQSRQESNLLLAP